MNRDLWAKWVHDKWGKLVFDAQTIYVVARDRGEFRQIVSEEGPYALEPAWSPLGDELLYKQQVGNQLNQYQIFKIPVEGGMPEQLTDTGVIVVQIGLIRGPCLFTQCRIVNHNVG